MWSSSGLCLVREGEPSIFLRCIVRGAGVARSFVGFWACVTQRPLSVVCQRRKSDRDKESLSDWTLGAPRVWWHGNRMNKGDGR